MVRSKFEMKKESSFVELNIGRGKNCLNLFLRQKVTAGLKESPRPFAYSWFL